MYYIMTRDYFKSPEGLAEYEKISMSYPEEIYDRNYEHFCKLTKNTKEKDYKIHIQSMMRHILASGEEYILYGMSEVRYDPLGNKKTFYRVMGKYPRPIPRW
jgi:hypothetical protein